MYVIFETSIASVLTLLLAHHVVVQSDNRIVVLPVLALAGGHLDAVAGVDNAWFVEAYLVDGVWARPLVLEFLHECVEHVYLVQGPLILQCLLLR